MRKLKVLAAAALALAFTAGAASAQVVVSSKIDTEGGLLGNIISQVLQANGIPVTEKIQLGASKIVRDALVAGQIDIYPEYTGNGAFIFNKGDDPAWNDAAKAYAEVAKLDYDANKIVWLAPAPANNTWAVALRKDLAEPNKIVTFSDFGKYVAGGGQVKLAVSAEFVSSPGALPKFESTYGFTLKPDQLVTLSGGDTAATIAAAANQTSGVNGAMVYGTDGGISRPRVWSCCRTDDKNVQPVYPARPDHSRSRAHQVPRDQGSARSGVRQARSRDLADAQRPHPGRRRAGQGRRDRLAEDQRLSEVSSARSGQVNSPPPTATWHGSLRLRASRPLPRRNIDRLGVVICVIAALGLFLPFILFRANRIVPGQARSILESFPGWSGYGIAALLAAAAASTLWRTQGGIRLLVALIALLGLAVGLGIATDAATAPGDTISRTSPAAGFWLEALAFGLLAADAVTRLRLRAFARIGLLLVTAATVAVILASGLWDNVSVLREYANRADSFWREAGTHLLLAFGSLVIAAAIGLPLGLLVHPTKRVRAVDPQRPQCRPDDALDCPVRACWIAPLAWVAANVPGAAAAGIAGIGAAPAMVALVLYSLMPVVSNTLSGLDGVPAEANEAARGMGMTDGERLVQVQLPLAFPSILAAIRIALVQNIGLATVASLIGGGGFGVFVFQGVGQTAMDLVLLGAVPTVALAFAAAVVLDAAVELVSVKERR